MRFGERGESGVRSRLRCRLFRPELHALTRAPLLDRLRHALVIGIGRVHQQGDHARPGTSSTSSSSRLGISSLAKRLTPVRLPPGRAKLRDEALPASPTKTIGIAGGRLFRGRVPVAAAARHDHVDLAADEVGGQCGQPIIVGPPPSGIRSPRFVPRRSRFRSAPGGTRPQTARTGRARRCRGNRSPASPSAARGGHAAAVIAPPSSSINSRRLIR